MKIANKTNILLLAQRNEIYKKTKLQMVGWIHDKDQHLSQYL